MIKIKKQKAQKSVIKRFKFKDYKNCLEAAQIENKTNHLEKNKTDVYSLKDDQKEFIKNEKLMFKTQHIFRNEKQFFTEEISETILSSNNDTKMPSIDLVETYAYGMNKDLVYQKEEIKCNNIMKQY